MWVALGPLAFLPCCSLHSLDYLQRDDSAGGGIASAVDGRSSGGATGAEDTGSGDIPPGGTLAGSTPETETPGQGGAFGGSAAVSSLGGGGGDPGGSGGLGMLGGGANFSGSDPGGAHAGTTVTAGGSVPAGGMTGFGEMPNDSGQGGVPRGGDGGRGNAARGGEAGIGGSSNGGASLAGNAGQDGVAGAIPEAGGGPQAGGPSPGGGGAAGGPVGAGGASGSAGSIGGTAGVCFASLLRASLVHRYEFNGTGTVVTDSVGTAHGTVINAALSGIGTVELSGSSSDQYIDLPNGMVSVLSEATLEVWVSWRGGESYQRILEFGDTTSGAEGQQGTGRTFLLLSPSSPSLLRASYRSAETGSLTADAPTALPTGTMAQVVVVLSSENQRFQLYVDGVLQAQAGGMGSLSAINDINNWLGRSQYSDDPEFAGTYHEFRIYQAALGPTEIQASFALGPDDPLNQE